MTSVAARSTSYRTDTPPSKHSLENGRMNEHKEDVMKKREVITENKNVYPI